MLFGRSLFETVLTRMEEEAPPPAPPEPDAARIRGFTSGFVTEAMEGISVSLHRIDGAYRDFAEDEDGVFPDQGGTIATPQPMPVDDAPPQMPTHLQRLLPAEIAEDLGLSASDTLEGLSEKRRLFARANHPDIVHSAHREAANLRMTTANLLIDRAIARIEASRKLGLL